MTILIIATHPDDEVLGCGGVMSRYAAEGQAVHVLVISRGIPELFPPEEIEKTRAELRQAHALLGVASVEFLDFPAPDLDTIPGRKLADAIGKVIRRLQPTVVYIPHHGDIHADHQAVYKAALVAIRPINNCPVKKLLCYETLSETEWASPLGGLTFVPNVFVDITNYLHLKLRAMECYRSQLRTPPHSRSLRSIEALAHLRGGTVSLEAAEAFELVREIA